MRRFVFPALLALALAWAASAPAASLFLISGKGWGHGIGLSQYGAYGFAQQGWTHDQILTHYYPGTALGSAPGGEVRVLLAQGRRFLKIGSAAPFTVTDAEGRTYTLDAGTHRLGPKLRVKAGGELQALTGPVRFDPGASPLELGRPYRGSLVVNASNGLLSAVNHVGLEGYLYGVVPGEMPAGWAPEALKAQAVAARSYALGGRRSESSFDLYADTRSQVYRGFAIEDERTSAAIDATAGQVVLYGGAIARTFFYSTSGGRTASITDVWPDAQPLPYLVSVEDPYDSISPYHRWGPVVFTGREVADRLGPGAPRGLRDLTVQQNGSGRVSTVTATGANGAAVIPAGTLRKALGLRSTWFDIGVLSLTPAPARVVFGQKLVLAGIVRGVDGVSLEQKVTGGNWEPALPADGAVTAGADGAFEAVARPRLTTWYRLVFAGAKGPAHRVPVAARVNFYEGQDGNGLAGRVRPKVAGAAVEIQRLENGSWQTVDAASTDAAGDFWAEFAVTPGTYRAVARVGAGLVPGTTPPLEIVAG